MLPRAQAYDVCERHNQGVFANESMLQLSIHHSALVSWLTANNNIGSALKMCNHEYMVKMLFVKFRLWACGYAILMPPANPCATQFT